MTGALLTAFSVAVAVCLAGFAIRRVLLLAAAALPPRPIKRGDDLPSVTLLIPAHNEGAEIKRALDAVGRIDYPPERLFVVLIDDGSDDLTGVQMACWAADRPRALALRLIRRGGRPEALNEGIGAAPRSELVVVCDADVRPRFNFLGRLVEPFGDESVGAAAAFVSPDIASPGPAARYAAVEAWVHQLVTSAGKDRLDLNPPTLGAAAYRRAALEQVGGFGPGVTGDDVRATVALTRAGWRTRFVPEAVADNPVVSGWRDYWRQHMRWARDLFSLGGGTGKRDSARLGPSMELWMLSSGYADRVALAAALGLAAGGRLPFWMPIAYLGVTAVEVTAAVAKARPLRQVPLFLAWTAAFFALDVAASITAAMAQILRWPRRSPLPSRVAAPTPERPLAKLPSDESFR